MCNKGVSKSDNIHTEITKLARNTRGAKLPLMFGKVLARSLFTHFQKTIYLNFR